MTDEITPIGRRLNYTPEPQWWPECHRPVRPSHGVQFIEFDFAAVGAGIPT